MHSSISSSEARGILRLGTRLAALSPILALLVGVNYGVDPAGLYRNKGKSEKEIATLLAAGLDVAVLAEDRDERRMRAHQAELLPAPPDVLVLGSSRLLQFGQDAVPGARLLNASVSGAVLEDIVGLYGTFRRHRRLPRVLVLGLDPWLLNANHGETRWTSIREDVFRMLDALDVRPPTSQIPAVEAKWANLVSPSYFQASVRSLAKRGLQPAAAAATWFPTDEREGFHAVLLADGTVSYGEEFRRAGENPEEVRKLAIGYGTADSVYHMDRYVEMDPALMALLERFLHQAERDRVKVVLFLPPYHPETWSRLSRRADMRMAAQAERYFRKIAAQRGLAIQGSYDPWPCGLEGSRFYDGMHLKRDAVREILASAVLSAYRETLAAK